MANLLLIDELLKNQHYYLTEDDICYYFMEYIPNSRDSVHSMIMNFKKKVDRRGKAEWVYKGRAIIQIGKIFATAIPDFEAQTLLVPIPPSKAKDHPLYDDRMIKLLNHFIQGRQNCEVREILTMKQSIESSHDAVIRPSPEELKEYIEANEKLCTGNFERIILFDDVITEGAHFKACKDLLQEQFPNSTIEGIFIARCVHK